MPLTIKEIDGRNDYFSEGDAIISIGGIEVDDQLDVFYLTAGEGSAEFVVRKKDGATSSRKLRLSDFSDYGISYEEMSFINCRSKCIFCFVEQTPSGLRPPLYQKDDDYRLSFLFGNYVTLNDVTKDEIRKIIEYNLSPLYVSVHATEMKIREKIFGRPLKNDIIDILGALSSSEIAIHCQAVLVPGVNDGKVLERTVDDLIRLYPGCRSLALVPVGLTSHRRALPKLKGYTKKSALELLRFSEKLKKKYPDITESDPFIFPSDEFYLMAGEEIPDESEYGSFEQLSNGVGMSRLFIEDVKDAARSLRETGVTGVSMTVVTGVLGKTLIDRYLCDILSEELPEHEIRFVTAKNRLFGSMVTVSGLLCGRDIIESVTLSGISGGPVILPPNCINHEGLLLDDLSIEDMKAELGTEVLVAEETFLDDTVIQRCKVRKRKR